MGTAEAIRANQARETDRQIQASNFGAPEPTQYLANGIPVVNDAALAAQIEEWKKTDISYQRAQNEEQREQIEAAYAASQQRLNAAKQAVKDRSALETEQRNQADNYAGERLALQMQALTDTFPRNWTPETLSLPQLRQLSDLRQQVNNLAAATGMPGLADGVLESGGPLAPVNVLQQTQPPRMNQRLNPQPFADGKMYQLENLPDGNLKVKLATGEEFSGDPITVTQKLAEAKVNTAVWARNKIQEAQSQLQPSQQPTAQPTEQTASGSLSDDLAARQADAIARQLGFNDLAEAKQSILDMGRVKEQVQEFEELQLAARFHAACPDFPDTQETAETVMSIISSNGWQTNLDSLQAAHALAVRNGLYQPLTPEQIQIANGAAPQQHTRPAPHPMLRTGNPDVTNAGLSPWDMSMADLRKAAIAQELGRNG